MTQETVATRMLLDMTEAIMEKDKDKLRELLSQKVAIKNAIMVDEYLKDRYIALLEGALKVNRQEFETEIECLHNRIAELERMITDEQKERIKRIALQRQVTFEQIVREAIDAYLLPK